MSEQIRDAIQSRLDMGQTREQIQQEFLSAGYDSKEFDQFFYSFGNTTFSTIPTKSKLSFWKPVLIIESLLLLALLSVSGYFLYSQYGSEIPQEISKFEVIETATTTAHTATTTVVAPIDFEQSDIAQIVEQEADKQSAKFINDNGEGIIGFYEAYVDGVKFLEASSTPALTAMKNCLLNIYQNPSYSFTCYVDGIQGVSATPKVPDKSKFLFLQGPDIDHRIFYISTEQIPSAKNITYGGVNDNDVHATLFFPEEYSDEYLEFFDKDNITTRHDGRHFLGGHATNEPLAHMVVYIDLDDPFSKHFYPNILELRELYTVEELVIEVQHLPLTQLHPNAAYLANASHCAADQGDEYYWLFIKGVFEGREVNSAYEMSQLPQLVENIGLNINEFTSCTEYGAYESVVVKQAQIIITSGARGTPHTIIFNGITRENEPEVLEGARSLSELISAVDAILES